MKSNLLTYVALVAFAFAFTNMLVGELAPLVSGVFATVANALAGG